MKPVTVNFDGIPGPTHNYAGLAHGNLAAERNAQLVANPREAARQGLGKMRALAARGFAQGVLGGRRTNVPPCMRWGRSESRAAMPKSSRARAAKRRACSPHARRRPPCGSPTPPR